MSRYFTLLVHSIRLLSKNRRELTGLFPPNVSIWLFLALKQIFHLWPNSAHMSNIFCKPRHDPDNKVISSAYRMVPTNGLAVYVPQPECFKSRIRSSTYTENNNDLNISIVRSAPYDAVTAVVVLHAWWRGPLYISDSQLTVDTALLVVVPASSSVSLSVCPPSPSSCHQSITILRRSRTALPCHSFARPLIRLRHSQAGRSSYDLLVWFHGIV